MKRQKTIQRLKLQKFEEGVEALFRVFKKPFKRNSRVNKNKKQQKKKVALVNKSLDFEDDRGASKKHINKDQIRQILPKIDDLNLSRSKSASRFDLSIDISGIGDYESDSY